MVSRGVYNVKESGLDFEHSTQQQEDVPVSPRVFLQNFSNNFEMRVLSRPSPNELVFEMINVDTSFVNALRRILLAEVPTVAIEHVYMWNNSSIIHDEVLAHRLGLVPLAVDARLLDELNDDAPTDRNTMVFRLAVSCPKQPATSTTSQNSTQAVEHDVVQPNEDLTMIAQEAAATTTRPQSQHQQSSNNMSVYSKDLTWIPQGNQEEWFDDDAQQILYDDILLAKLRPGQAIELEAHACKGIGKDHAKYSPVATASYRLAPHIELLEDVYDDHAEQLVHVYEPGVFELTPTVPGKDPPESKVKAVLVNPNASTMSRNYMRCPVLNKAIKMTRIPNHFIFSVESVGTYSPAVLVAEALRTLQRKCHKLMYHIDESSQVET